MVASVEDGFGFGLIVTAFWLGFRHGIDWDHIAAITDITSSQEERNRAMWLGTLYVLGHAAVVLLLGVAAILVGERLPESVDDVMGRVVGATLLLLGVYVFASLIRHGRDFRLRSRWMLIFSGVSRGLRWVRERARPGPRGTASETSPDPLTASSVATLERVEAAENPTLWHHGHHGRPGHHHHASPSQEDLFANYTGPTAVGVGMIHGVGGETPTQVLIFLAAAGAGGSGVGVLVLVVFLVGLVAANSLITLGSAVGFLSASGNFGVYATVAVITGLFSLGIGALFLLGQDALLPAFFVS